MTRERSSNDEGYEYLSDKRNKCLDGKGCEYSRDRNDCLNGGENDKENDYLNCEESDRKNF